MPRRHPRSNAIIAELAAGYLDHRGQEDDRSRAADDWRLERLIDRLPQRFRSTVRWLRQPSSTWIRVPAGVLLSCGGVLGFLPVLGLWMLPVGLVLLADDVPPLRSLRSRILDGIERRHPRWLAAAAHLPDAPAQHRARR
jgi:hypothetical protein